MARRANFSNSRLHFHHRSGHNTNRHPDRSPLDFTEDLTMNPLRRFACLLALAALPTLTQVSLGSPECCGGKNEPPLAQQFEDAQIVLFGHFENPKLAAKGLDMGTTDFIIEHVYKDHPMVQGKK